MTGKKDTRWVQRFEKYCDAFERLSEGLDWASKRQLSHLEKAGMIKHFELVYELSWQVLKDFLESEYADRLKNEAKNGKTLSSPASTFRHAAKYKVISSARVLLEAVEDRNLTVHTYNEDTAQKILDHLINKYYKAFNEVRQIFLAEKLKRAL